VIADDFGAMRHRLESFVPTLGKLSVVATASNGYEAWDAIVRLKPEFALVDFQMPGLTGLEIASRAHAGGLPTHVVVISLHDSPEVRSCCLAAGAAAFVSKQRLSAELPGTLSRLIQEHPASHSQ
jgi:two-component system nitrate/nitrite response regulator NarL